MNELIEYGIISPGDIMYIVCNTDDPDAELLDSKYVAHKGEKWHLMSWAAK